MRFRVIVIIAAILLVGCTKEIESTQEINSTEIQSIPETEYELSDSDFQDGYQMLETYVHAINSKDYELAYSYFSKQTKSNLTLNNYLKLCNAQNLVFDSFLELPDETRIELSKYRENHYITQIEDRNLHDFTSFGDSFHSRFELIFENSNWKLIFPSNPDLYDSKVELVTSIYKEYLADLWIEEFERSSNSIIDSDFVIEQLRSIEDPDYRLLAGLSIAKIAFLSEKPEIAIDELTDIKNLKDSLTDLDLPPEYIAQFYYILGASYKAQSNNTNAIFYLNEAISLYPEYEEAIELRNDTLDL